MLPFFTALVFGTMSPSLNHTQYADHYTNIHIPLVKNLTGPDFPVIHTRYYAGGNPAFVNASAKADWDSMAVMSFRDQAHAAAFMGIVSRPEVAAVIARDEEEFMAGKPRTVVVGMEGDVTWS